MKDLNEEYRQYHNGAQEAIGVVLILGALLFIAIGFTIGLTILIK